MSAGIRIPINEQLTLDLRPGSSLARLAKLSPHELLRDVEKALAFARERTSPLEDWAALFLDASTPNATADSDRLFCSYFQFCDAAGIADRDRLSFSAFGRALTDMGYTMERRSDGRTMRRGCCLLRRSGSSPLFDPEPLVDQFLAERCDLSGGVKVRVRSTRLHDSYRNWALQNGGAPLSIKKFGAALQYRGLEKIHSNGVFWLSIALRDEASQSPCPSVRGAHFSNVEQHLASEEGVGPVDA